MLLKTKRKRLLLILFIAMLICFATLTSIYFLMREQIADFINQKTTEIISKSLKAEISAEKIEGNIFRGLVLSQVEIVFPSGDSFYADIVEVEYDFFSIIRQRGNKIHQLKLIHPTIHLAHQSHQPASSSKINLNFTLPLLFINRLEILDGRLLSSGTIIVDTFSLLANLNLRAIRAQCLIKKLSFFIPNLQTKVENIQGTIDLQNNIVKLSDFTIRSTLTSANFDAQINLDKQQIDLKIKNSDMNLKTTNKNSTGKITLDGTASVSFLLSNWTISNIKSDINYQVNNLSIQNNLIPDGKGKLLFKENSLTVNYRSLANDSISRSEINLFADVYFNPISYQGRLNFTNLPIKLADSQYNYLEGAADFKGIKTDSVDVNIIASSKTPQIESISAQAKIRKGKLILEQLRIKDKTNILDANGQGQIIAGRKEFRLNLLFNNFSLSFLTDLLNPFIHTETSLAGVINGGVIFESRGNSIASSAKITIKNGNYDKLQFDHLSLGYQLDDITKPSGFISLSSDSIFWADNYFAHFGYFLRDSNFSLQINNWQNNSLVANGKLSIEDKNIDCLVDSLQILGFSNIFRTTQLFGLGIHDEQLYLRDFSLATDVGTLSLDITKKPASPPIINLATNQFDLRTISNLLSIKHPLNGIVNFNVTTSENPLFYNVSLSAHDIDIPITTDNDNPVGLKFIQGSLGINDSIISINEIAVVYVTDTSKISGSILLNRQPIEQLPLDIQIKFADPGPWIFFFLRNIIDLREGKIYGLGNIGGTLKKPILKGNITISDGTIYLVPTKTVCTNVNTQLIFDQQDIVIKNLQGTVGPGNITADGFTRLLEFTKVDTLSYQIKFQDAPFRPDKDIFAIASGNINIDLREDNNIREKTPLSLAGDIHIKEALITTEFEVSPSAKTGEPADIDFNLKITGGRDIWLRNRMCDVELSANLNIFRQDKNAVYSGELIALQGKLYYLDHTLTLTKGMLIFDNISELNPELDISAELATRQIEVQPGQFERMKIILALTGRLKEPIFVFSSDPSYLTQNDIISYLTFNVTWQEMSASESRETFTNAIGDKLLGYFERELTKRIRNLIYLDYLWIESGLLSGNGAKVTVGKYISPKLYFTYEYDITGNIYDIFRLEYYFTKSHEAIGEHDKDGRYKLKYQYKIRY